jgi:hypothetical protein
MSVLISASYAAGDTWRCEATDTTAFYVVDLAALEERE